MAGSSERPCVRCAADTPKMSAMVAWMSTLVVSMSRRPGAMPGQRIISGIWTIGWGTGTPGLSKIALDRVEPPAQPMVDHRQLGAVVVAQFLRLGGREHAALDRIHRVGRPYQQRLV